MKTYAQYCGLAKALDRVGDRWTLLIVRELLLGPRRYSELRSALGSVPTNLLADRLRSLADDGIVCKAERGDFYELTEIGAALKEPVLALIRWGGTWMVERGPDERFEPGWLALALQALVRSPVPRSATGTVAVEADGARLVVAARRGEVRIDPRSTDPARASVAAPPELILGLFAGALDVRRFRRAGGVTSGETDVLETILAAFGMPG